MRFEGQQVSADIEKASLLSVVEKVEAQTGIWVKGKGYLKEETTSIYFEEMSIERGIERILFSMNYSLIFDEDSTLLGVVILGKPESSSKRVRKYRARTRRPVKRRSVRRPSTRKRYRR